MERLNRMEALMKTLKPSEGCLRTQTTHHHHHSDDPNQKNDDRTSSLSNSVASSSHPSSQSSPERKRLKSSFSSEEDKENEGMSSTGEGEGKSAEMEESAKENHEDNRNSTPGEASFGSCLIFFCIWCFFFRLPHRMNSRERWDTQRRRRRRRGFRHLGLLGTWEGWGGTETASTAGGRWEVRPTLGWEVAVGIETPSLTSLLSSHFEFSVAFVCSVEFVNNVYYYYHYFGSILGGNTTESNLFDSFLFLWRAAIR